MNDKATELYADIIHLPHHRSANRIPMSMQERAAQFSSFAALAGHSDAIHETARLSSQRFELSELVQEDQDAAPPHEMPSPLEREEM